MKLFRLLPLTLFTMWFCSTAAATPSISSYSVGSCTYTVGVSQTPCSMGPGSLITVNGSGFTSAGIVSTCDCPQIIVPSGDWTNTRITGYVCSVAASFSSGIQVETSGGTWSASGVAPYTALAAQITKVVVGSCTYIPDQSPQQCVITAGTQFTI